MRESYAWADGQGEWASLVDRGRQAFEAGALYVPVEGSPEFMAQLARSLLARPARAAAAVPAGRLAIERLDGVNITSGPAPGPVALYAIVGADLTPSHVWLREDAGQALFAMVDPGWALVAQGHESDVAGLLARQLEAETRHLEVLQQRLAHPLPGVTVIRAVRWFDARRAVMRGPADVTVAGGPHPRRGARRLGGRRSGPTTRSTAAAARCCRGCTTCTATSTAARRC